MKRQHPQFQMPYFARVFDCGKADSRWQERGNDEGGNVGLPVNTHVEPARFLRPACHISSGELMTMSAERLDLTTMAGKPDGGHVPVREPFDIWGITVAWPMRRFAGILLASGLVLLAAGCGGYWEGDQWAGVKVINNTNYPVTLDLDRARRLSSGETTMLGVDSNSNPQALRIFGANGRVLGCLTFQFHTTSAEDFSANVSDITACDKSLRLVRSG